MNNTYLINLTDTEREAVYDRFIVALAKSKVITDIHISNCGLTDKVGVWFARLLRTNTTIVDMSLEQCDIRETGMAEFAAVLATTKTLVELRLQHQFKPNIPTQTIEAFVAAVEANGVTTICSINQRDRSLKVRMDRALAKNKEDARKAEFTKWNAQGRPGETYNAVQKEINALPTATMTKLSFKNNPMFEKMPTHWINEIFPEKLAGNKTITSLDLSALELTDTFAFAFAQVLAHGETPLEQVNLSSNSFSAKGLTAIGRVLGGTGLHR